MLTMEKTATTDESMQMRENHFYGDVTPKLETLDIKMMNMVKANILILNEELRDAKANSYDLKNDPYADWKEKWNRDCMVKVCEGKLEAMKGLERAFKNMLTPNQPPSN